MAFCSEHFISINNRILATFNINKKFNSDSLCAFNRVFFITTLFSRLYVSIDMLLQFGKHFHDRIISLKKEVWAHKTA